VETVKREDREARPESVSETEQPSTAVPIRKAADTQEDQRITASLEREEERSVPQGYREEQPKDEVGVADERPDRDSGKLPPPKQKLAEEQSRYQITWGDTLWRITERFYRDRDLYSELAESNELDDPDHIIAGEYLQLPYAFEGTERRAASE
jgi:nucleoid-associated protein YgaU